MSYMCNLWVPQSLAVNFQKEKHTAAGLMTGHRVTTSLSKAMTEQMSIIVGPGCDITLEEMTRSSSVTQFRPFTISIHKEPFERWLAPILG